MPGMIVLDCLHLLLIDLKIFKLEKKGKKGMVICLKYQNGEKVVYIYAMYHLMILTRDCLHLRQTVAALP